MKNAILQIKKFRGTNKVVNENINKVYFINNVIFWTDFTVYYKKEIDFNFNGCYSTDLKAINDIMKLKTIKKVENIEIKDNILTINNAYRVSLLNEKMELPENIYNDGLLAKKILSDVNIKEFQKFNVASSKFEQYSILKNICIKKDRLAVTDGNRLHYLQVKTENVAEDKVYLLNGVLIDKNIGTDKELRVYANNDDTIFSTVSKDGKEIISTSFDIGNYPKFEQLIPKYEKDAVILNRKEFLNTLKGMKNLISMRTKVIVLDFVNNKIKGLKDTLINEVDFNFNYKGELGYIAFNCDFLIDICNYLNDDNIVLKLDDNSKLACGILENKDNKDKLALVMPIKIDESDFNVNALNINKINAELEAEFKAETETETEFKKEISIDSPEAIEMKKEFDEINEKMINSKEYKELINKESEQIMTNKKENEQKQVKTAIYEHVNAVTKHVYNGGNAELLEKSGFTDCREWVGSRQARKLKKQVKKNAKGVVIKIYKEEDGKQVFVKLETVYNVKHELEAIKAVETTNQFQSMVNKFKSMFGKKVSGLKKAV